MPIISGKALGRKKPLFDDFSVPLPPNPGEGGRTLRQLISQIVCGEVAAFQKRQHDRQFLRALTAREIEEGAAKGKIESGGSEVAPQQVDPDEAVGTALQAFEDGLFLVVLDGEEKRSLDEQIYVNEESRITFVRLTLLAGG